ncbi:MAG: UDP-N-acetylglucosamine 2-epimerase (non-hydrolyzing) [Rhodospirillaceae bacterium]|nr:UDP-N-acetylglucosamine 2-epimerase (non-hydrolyzing) [Rhodospirillaceae bacterium]
MAQNLPKIVCILGNRPHFVKYGPIHRVLVQRGRIREVIIHTDQHHDPDMSDVFFRELEIPAPDHSLGISGGGNAEMAGRMMIGLDKVIENEAPDLCLVLGDTNSTLAGALVAASLGIPVAHVEAGLRSFDRSMPEEINRITVDHLSTVLFAPTSNAIQNLTCEGLVNGVHHVGDVMYDATLQFRNKAQRRSNIRKGLNLEEGQYATATVHRAKTTDRKENLKEALDYLREEARTLPIYIPVHPRTESRIEQYGLSTKGLHTIRPLGYFDMLSLVAGSARVYTDSGGLQKEAYFLRVPCVTLRDNTEWKETIASGWNRLWREKDWNARHEIDDYGSGDAAEKIIDVLERLLLDGSG